MDLASADYFTNNFFAAYKASLLLISLHTHISLE